MITCNTGIVFLNGVCLKIYNDLHSRALNLVPHVRKVQAQVFKHYYKFVQELLYISTFFCNCIKM